MGKPLPPGGAGLTIGVALIGLAAVVALSTSRMQVPPSYAKVGPGVFPYVAALGLAGLGASFAIEALWRPLNALRAEPHRPTDWVAVASVSAGLIAFILCLGRAGFVPAASVLFLATTVAFGSRRWRRDLPVALLFVLAVEILFVEVLGLPLPAGPLQGLH
jgi:putative tricarboxylic transport membrane protein